MVTICLVIMAAIFVWAIVASILEDPEHNGGALLLLIGFLGIIFGMRWCCGP